MAAPIYLDYNASTPVDPAVVEAMLPALTEHFGNPSGDHVWAWAADEAVALGRERLAALVGAETEEVIYTAGATEAVNLAIRGTFAVYRAKKNHIVTVATEHKAVLEACAAVEREGARVTILGVDSDGLVDLDGLRAALTDETLLVSVMWANNETGVIQPIREIAEAAHERGAFVMSDATQAVGKIPVSMSAAGVDLLACSGHKLYAPKGVGALVRRRRARVRLEPQIVGGGHEGGLRSGTLNVPGIVALGKAAEVAGTSLSDEATRLGTLRDRFEAALTDRLSGVRINGGAAPRLPNTANLVFPGVRTAKLLPAMRGLAVSTGSACQTKVTKPSHVLTAMGLDDADAFASVRFSLGRFTTDDEVDRALKTVVAAVEAVRTEPTLV